MHNHGLGIIIICIAAWIGFGYLGYSRIKKYKNVSEVRVMFGGLITFIISLTYNESDLEFPKPFITPIDIPVEEIPVKSDEEIQKELKIKNENLIRRCFNLMPCTEKGEYFVLEKKWVSYSDGDELIKSIRKVIKVVTPQNYGYYGNCVQAIIERGNSYEVLTGEQLRTMIHDYKKEYGLEMKEFEEGSDFLKM